MLNRSPFHSGALLPKGGCYVAARALAALSRLLAGGQGASSDEGDDKLKVGKQQQQRMAAWVRSNVPLLERFTLSAAAHLRTADAADLTELVAAFAALGFYPGNKFLRWHDSSCTRLHRAFPDAKLCKVKIPSLIPPELWPNGLCVCVFQSLVSR